MKRISIVFIILIASLTFSCSYGPVPSGTLSVSTDVTSGSSIIIPQTINATCNYSIQDYSSGSNYRIGIYIMKPNPHYLDWDYDSFLDEYLYYYVEHKDLIPGIEANSSFAYQFNITSTTISGAVHPYKIIFVLIYTDTDGYSDIIARTDPVIYN